MSQSTALQAKPTKEEILKRIIIKGDLSDLTPEQQVSYYVETCMRYGFDPLSKPFDFMEIEDQKTKQKKIVLYANKECAAQLRVDRGVSVYQLDEVIENDYYKVTAYARTPDGREDRDKGVAFVKGLIGKTYENAVKKAITQAKRRVTLSICGLGHLDESEIGDVEGARTIPHPEQDAMMTEREADELTIAHKASPLDQWKCGRALAMQILTIWTALKVEGAEEETLRSWLPTGIQSRKDLSEAQARAVIKVFQDRLVVIKQACLAEWKCAPDLAIRLMKIYGELIGKGVDKATIQQRLPGGVQSFKDLTEAQAQDALKAFTHWLNSYNQVIEGGANNG